MDVQKTKRNNKATHMPTCAVLQNITPDHEYVTYENNPEAACKSAISEGTLLSSMLSCIWTIAALKQLDARAYNEQETSSAISLDLRWKRFCLIIPYGYILH